MFVRDWYPLAVRMRWDRYKTYLLALAFVRFEDLEEILDELRDMAPEDPRLN